jgi:hypothetical protein
MEEVLIAMADIASLANAAGGRNTGAVWRNTVQIRKKGRELSFSGASPNLSPTHGRRTALEPQPQTLLLYLYNWNEVRSHAQTHFPFPPSCR